MIQCLKDLDSIQPLVMFNIAPNNRSTDIVISWLKEHHRQAEWILGAAKDSEKFESLVNQMAFGESEDTFINPSLWRMLSDKTKKEVLTVMHHNLLREPTKIVPNLINL